MIESFYIGKYNSLFQNVISSFYPFKKEEFINYMKIFDFKTDLIYENPNIIWTDEIFESIYEYFNFSKIGLLKNFTLTYDFIKTYERFFDFNALPSCKYIQNVDEIISEFGEAIPWKTSIINKTGFNKIKYIRKYKDKFDWDDLSKNLNHSIDDEFITEFKDYLNFELLSKNPNLVVDITLLKKYKESLNFHLLSANPAAIDFILKYPKFEKWHWNYVLLNMGLKITEENLHILFKYKFKTLQSADTQKRPDSFFILLSKILTISHIINNGLPNADLVFEPQFQQFYDWNIIQNCNYNYNEEFFYQYSHKFNLNKSTGSWRKFVSSEFILDRFDLKNGSFYTLP